MPKAVLVIAGDGALRSSLEALAGRLGVAERVRFLGFRDDTAEILHGSDAFVLTSSSEGNPMALMEAMALGLPVVSTAVGGIPEVLENGRHGILVSASAEPGTIAAEMARLASDASWRLAWSSRARAHAMAAFSAHTMAARYTNLYSRVLNRAETG